MPADSFVVRFATDEEGRDVQHQAIVSTADLPYPPHLHAAMAVATAEDGSQRMVGIAISPDPTVDYAGYREVLMDMEDGVKMTAAMLGFAGAPIHVVWFTRVKASQMDEEMADAPHLIRGVLYRPTTLAELEEWAGPERAANSHEVEVHFGDSDG